MVPLNVTEKIIHFFQAACGSIVKVDLQRCRPVRRHGQPVAIEVAGQEHGDIDTVAAHAPGQSSIGDPGGGNPMIGVGAELGGDAVVELFPGIEKYLEHPSVMIFDERQQIAPHRMIIKIRRNISDP